MTLSRPGNSAPTPKPETRLRKTGRYGPFAQVGSRDDEEKPRFAGLRPGQKIDTISLEEALALFHLHAHWVKQPRQPVRPTSAASVPT